jgi:mono/diheme cytochrome c family protein
MKKMIRSQVVLALVASVACAVSFAEDGKAIYTANCQSCHGSTGTPSAGIAKMFDVKPAADYKSSEAEQIAAVTNGKGKMKPQSPKLTAAQISAAVKYFRTLK